MWWGCRCLRLVVWFVAGAHVTEIRGLVSYRWCDGLIFVAGLALGWYIFVCFLPIAPESIVCCVLTAYRLRIDSVLNRSKICHKWDPRNDPHAQIFSFRVTHRLKYSFLRWPKLLENTIQSLLIAAVCEKLDCVSSAYWSAHNAYRTFFYIGFPAIAYRAKHKAYRTRIELRIATLSMISCVSKSTYRNRVSRHAYLRIVSRQC